MLSYVIYKVEKNTKVSSFYLHRGKTVPLTENYKCLQVCTWQWASRERFTYSFWAQNRWLTGDSQWRMCEPRLVLQGFMLDTMATPCCTEWVSLWEHVHFPSQPLFSLSFHDWGKYLTRGWLSADYPWGFPEYTVQWFLSFLLLWYVMTKFIHVCYPWKDIKPKVVSEVSAPIQAALAHATH